MFAAHGEVEIIALVGEVLADVGGQVVEFGVGFGDSAHGGGDGCDVAIALGDVVKQDAVFGIEVGDDNHGVAVAGAVVVVFAVGAVAGEFSDGYFQAAFPSNFFNTALTVFTRVSTSSITAVTRNLSAPAMR